MIGEVGGPITHFGVSLYIYGATLNPQELTQLLGVGPDISAPPGFKRGPTSQPLKHGFWALERRVEDGGENPAQALLTLLNRLPADEVIWKDLSSRFEINVGVDLSLD